MKILSEQILEMDIDDLIGLVSKLTGEDLELVDEAEENVTGTLEPPGIHDPADLKRWLGFMLYALGERVEIPVED